ncbi:MAG: hypothetical protein WA081_14700 [Desulfosalsimonadaceae bacterium]
MRISVGWFLLSLLTLVGWSIARSLHPGNTYFPHHFFLIKYALDIFFINGAVSFLVMPFFINKGIIGADPREEDEFGKAKSFLIFYTILLPGLLLVFLATWLTRVGHIPFSLIMPLFCYGYLKNSYIFLKKRKK